RVRFARDHNANAIVSGTLNLRLGQAVTVHSAADGFQGRFQGGRTQLVNRVISVIQDNFARPQVIDVFGEKIDFKLIQDVPGDVDIFQVVDADAYLVVIQIDGDVAIHLFDLELPPHAVRAVRQALLDQSIHVDC